MLKLARLVIVVAFCSGLAPLSDMSGVLRRDIGGPAEYGSLSRSPSAWDNQPDGHADAVSVRAVEHRGWSDVPPWLQALLKRVSTWLDAVIDSVAERVSPLPANGAPVTTAAEPGPAPAASQTVEKVEASLVAQTNAARAAAGLLPLQLDATLTALARQRSQDMIDRDYFSHTDPGTGGSLVGPYCIVPLGVEYCGENLAGAAGLADAEANVVNRWLASDGHRENVLRSEFGRIGIGVGIGGRWGAIVTQLFAP